ncbi:MAG: tetratricopeptide repeat protein, partial [Myxococcota bacterium]|nr:tetratricopeptide repeat protein [Myxococcota bacterium]
MRRLRVLLFVFVCSCGWNPSRPFERDAPSVNKAVADLDAGDAASATKRLEEYLSTGDCKDGNIGTPDSLKRRADGTFDLGLALFRIGEQFGRRFGEEEAEGTPDEARRAQRHALVECARRIVETIVEGDTAGDLRARSHYLDGNLAFLDGDYRAAVRAYDRALALAPGEGDGGDPVGRDAAWNRAIALRRIDEQDKKDGGNDASQDASSDGSAPHDAGRDASHDAGRGKDAGSDASHGAPDSG